MWQENYLLLFRTAFLLDLDYCLPDFCPLWESCYNQNLGRCRIESEEIKGTVILFFVFEKRGKSPYIDPYAKVELI